MQEIINFLKTDPVFVTNFLGAIAGFLTVIGAKEIIAKAQDRYYKKSDEKEEDHKKLEKLEEDMGEVLALLRELKENEEKYLDNDMLVIANDLLMLQRKSKLHGKVAESCYPWYLKLYNRYKELNSNSAMEFDTEIEMNHKLIEKMLADGDVVADFKELYFVPENK